MATPTPPDVALAMDEDAFRAFYDRTSGALWGYLSRISGDRQVADDLLQESYYRLLKTTAAFESEAHRRNYLYRIATNLVRDSQARRRGRCSTPASRWRTCRRRRRHVDPEGARGRPPRLRPAQAARARAAVARLRATDRRTARSPTSSDSRPAASSCCCSAPGASSPRHCSDRWPRETRKPRTDRNPTDAEIEAIVARGDRRRSGDGAHARRRRRRRRSCGGGRRCAPARKRAGGRAADHDRPRAGDRVRRGPAAEPRRALAAGGLKGSAGVAGGVYQSCRPGPLRSRRSTSPAAG